MKVILSLILVLCFYNIGLAADKTEIWTLECISYTPKKMASIQEAKDLLTLRLLDQYQYAPLDVQITDTYVRLFKSGTKKSMVAGGVAGVMLSEFIAFDNIGAITCEDRRDGRVPIYVKDKGYIIKARMFFSTKKQALQFFDAFYTIVNNKSEIE